MAQTQIAREASTDAASRQKARAILSRAREVAGGVKNLQSVHDITRSLEMTQTMTGIKARQTLRAIFPGTLQLVSSMSPLGPGEMTAFYHQGGGWMKAGEIADPQLPGWQVRAAEQDLMRQLEWVLLSDLRGDRTISYVEQREVQGRLSDGIEIYDSKAGSVRLWVDAKSSQPVALQYRRIGAHGELAQIVDYFQDFQTLNGVRTPRRITTKSDGQPYMEAVVIDLKYNSGLKAENLGGQTSR